MIRRNEGQFIILTATIILLVIILFVASLHTSDTHNYVAGTPQIYVAIESVNQSLESAIEVTLGYYTHLAITQAACGGNVSATPSQQAEVTRVLDDQLGNLSVLYSGYGLLVKVTQAHFNIYPCTGVDYAGTSSAVATVELNMTGVGLTGFKDTVAYTLEAYTSNCTQGSNNVTCNVTVLQFTFGGANMPVQGLNQSFFFLYVGQGWQTATEAVYYGNGTYGVTWQNVASIQKGLPVAVENQYGVYALTFASF
jgi:hypothetical protein